MKRITVDLPDLTYRRLKAKAALQGCSIKELVSSVLARDLNSENPRRVVGRVALPLIRSKRPGWLKLTNKTINKTLLP
jgi:hypothetical protein